MGMDEAERMARSLMEELERFAMLRREKMGVKRLSGTGAMALGRH